VTSADSSGLIVTISWKLLWLCRKL
jgi:hypothetical protein